MLLTLLTLMLALKVAETSTQTREILEFLQRDVQTKQNHLDQWTLLWIQFLEEISHGCDTFQISQERKDMADFVMHFERTREIKQAVLSEAQKTHNNFILCSPCKI